MFCAANTSSRFKVIGESHAVSVSHIKEQQVEAVAEPFERHGATRVLEAERALGTHVVIPDHTTNASTKATNKTRARVVDHCA